MNFIVPSVAGTCVSELHNALLQITTASVSKSFQKFVNPSIRIRWSINRLHAPPWGLHRGCQGSRTKARGYDTMAVE